MPAIELRELIRRLTRRTTRALENGVDRCTKRTHFELTSEHLLLGLLEDEGSDFMLLVRHHRLEIARLRFVIERSLDDLRTGNAANPTFATPLRTWLEDASVEGAQVYSYPRIRSAMLFLLLVRDPERYCAAAFGGLLAPVPQAELARDLVGVVAGSNEEVEAPAVKARPPASDAAAPAPRAAPAPDRGPSAGAHAEDLRSADEGVRASLEARIDRLESALARAEQRIVTLAEAQTRADAALMELTRSLHALVTHAVDPNAASRD